MRRFNFDGVRVSEEAVDEWPRVGELIYDGKGTEYLDTNLVNDLAYHYIVHLYNEVEVIVDWTPLFKGKRSSNAGKSYEKEPD